MATSSQHRVSEQPKAALERIDQAFLTDEAGHLALLRSQLESEQGRLVGVTEEAVELVRRVRARAKDVSAMEAFMRQYDLSSEEGVILMCLAEALLRIPDNDTAEKLISDKLSDAHWETHLGKSESVFVNASTWGLMLTGKVVRLGQDKKSDLSGVMGRLVARSGEPMIRLAIRQAMKIMGHQYVMGRSIGEALERSKKKDNDRFRYSFDMLGEAALTAHDAERYRLAYRQAIEHLAKHQSSGADSGAIEAAPSISVKLSALHPRYHPDQAQRVTDELVPVVLELAELAQSHRVALTLDAEEADRLHLSLSIFAKVLSHPALAGWDGLGLALQAYQKRAWYVIDHLGELARETGHRIPVRLVKGAYWDTEIKYAQIEGLPSYPVFTRKASTDLSYLACAKKLLADPEAFYPQFATHNAHTICAIRAFAGDNHEYEYQRLHGMGVELYDEVMGDDRFVDACRVYAPVGAHKDLLPYLVRRLLENGANTSFVNRIVDESISPEQVVTDPLLELSGVSEIPHPKIPLPLDLYGASRQNSAGVNLASIEDQHRVASGFEAWESKTWAGGYRGACSIRSVSTSSVYSPFDTDALVGSVDWVSPESVSQVVAAAVAAQPAWDEVGIAQRAAVLDRMADGIEGAREELMALCTREAGKTIRDGVAEIREAIDFCRYYAAQARAGLAEPITLPGPTGELNQLLY
ncbi:MAG TPA: bifunctional proline dehydrogenase/L-glutamate gamma-semialdehyde dehydrogenase PutA, partial [Wenzhouxiangella sp.]